MGYDQNGAHSGGIGAKTGRNKNQLTYVIPRTTYIRAQYSFNLEDWTGIANLKPLACSLNGMLWMCEEESSGARWLVCFTRDPQTEEIIISQIADIDASENPLQRGRDWILTEHYFLAASGVDDSIYMVEVRPTSGLQYPYYGLLKEDWAINTEIGYSNETGWLYSDNDYAQDGSPPYGERLNPVIGGKQILNGWIVPRLDHWEDQDFASGWNGGPPYCWSNTCIRYVVVEPGLRHETIPHYDTTLDTPFGAWCGIPYVKIKYAVFVVGGEIYVRSDNYIGTGRFLPFRVHVDDGNTQHDCSYWLLNMHDFDCWRKNYPELNWDSVVVGKIGKTVVAFECNDAEYAPMDQFGVRMSPTGRYIPLARTVGWDEDPDGTDAELVPKLKTFTPAEAEEAVMSVLYTEIGDANNAYLYNRDLFKVCCLDEEGKEPTENDARPGYLGVGIGMHFSPAGENIVGGMGDYVAACEKNLAFVTDINPTFRQLAAPWVSMPASLETRMIPAAGNSPAKRAEYMALFNVTPGAIEITDIASAKEDLENEPATPAEEWERVVARPFDFRAIRISAGTDEYSNWLLCDRFPLAAPRFAGLSKESWEDEFSFPCAFIHPLTGAYEYFAFVPKTQDSYCRLVLIYDESPGVARLGLEFLDGSFEEIDCPSYLDGWVGVTDTYYYNTFNNGQMPNPNVWSPNNELKYGAPLESCDILRAYEMYGMYDASRVTGRAGPIPLEAENNQIAYDRYSFDLPWYDVMLPIRLGSYHAEPLLVDRANRSGGQISPPLTHVDTEVRLSGGEPIRCRGVAAAHWVKDRFLYREQPEMWRFSQMISAYKCRKGQSDNRKAADPAHLWEEDRFLMFGITVTDTELYKRIASPYKLGIEYTDLAEE